ncbi:MAG: hypothetical protein KH047_08355 [Eubacterium sp.]|nr:hypothetical protein [Eubacterium sp.]
MDILKKVGMFAAGTLFGTAGIKVLTSKDAKKVYANCTAAVSVQYVGATGGVTDKAIVDKMLAKYREDYK